MLGVGEKVEDTDTAGDEVVAEYDVVGQANMSPCWHREVQSGTHHRVKSAHDSDEDDGVN